MVNDVRGTGKRANVRFPCNQQRKTVTVRAKGRVKAGEEFLLSYGRGFWGARAGGAAAEASGAQQPHPRPPLSNGARQPLKAGAPQRRGDGDERAQRQPLKSILKKTARKTGRASEPGDDEDCPIEVATVRINMLRRAGSEGQVGTWLDAEHWQCNCRWDSRRAASNGVHCMHADGAKQTVRS